MKRNKSGLLEENRPILSTKEAVIYGFGIFGVQLLIGYMNSFQTEFYNKMYSGVDSNIFYVMAVILLVAKLLSCVADPIIGGIIDRSHLKAGKMRPFVLMSALPLAILTTLIFIYIPFGNKYGMYAYITVTTILWNIAMSFADIPTQGLLSLLSPDANERNKAAGISNFFKSAALMLPGIFVTIIMMILGDNPKIYYMATGIFMLVVSTALILLMYFKNKERVSVYSQRTITFKEMFSELKNNKMMLIVFMTFILGFARTMGLVVCVQANGALIGKVSLGFLDNLLGGGQPLDTTSNATWLPGILGGISGFVGVIIAPLINKRMGEKKTFYLFSLYGALFSIASLIAYCCLPPDNIIRQGGLYALIMVMSMQLVIGFMNGSVNYLPLVMTSDICDYREWKTGERREGVQYSILSMANKLSTALAVAVGILFVGISGYSAVAEITPKMQNIIFFAYIGFPGIGCLLSMLPVFFYKIDGKTKTEMRAAINEKRAAENQASDNVEVS